VTSSATDIDRSPPTPEETERLGRRTVLRAGLASGAALAALFLGVSGRDAEAARRVRTPAKKPSQSTTSSTTSNTNTGSSSNGSNGSNQSGNTTGSGTTGNNNTGTSNTGQNGTGTGGTAGAPGTGQSNTGQNAGGNTTGQNQTTLPTTGQNVTGSSVRCTTRGAIVDANNPANNRPAEKFCTPI
jgi:hypothetical protein